METRRVVRTEQGMRWPGGLHPHVTAVILADGRRIEVSDAIWQIDVRAATYEVLIDGRATEVVVERCERCAVDRLRTSRDSAEREHLLALVGASD